MQRRHQGIGPEDYIRTKDYYTFLTGESNRLYADQNIYHIEEKHASMEVAQARAEQRYNEYVASQPASVRAVTRAALREMYAVEGKVAYVINIHLHDQGVSIVSPQGMLLKLPD